MVTRKRTVLVAPKGAQAPRPPSPPQPTSPQAPPPMMERVRARLLIIEARFYEAICDELVRGAIAEIEAVGANYERLEVPGALEIPQALALAVNSSLIPRSAPSARYDGVVALGCVIRGETAHFDIVCRNANHWLMEVAIRHQIPLGNGILTVENEEQAMARAKGERQSKGADAVRACLRLLSLSRSFAGQGA